VAAAALIAGGAVAGGSSAGAQTNPFQKGPDPTSSTFTSSRGPFAVSQSTAIGASGFGGGTIYYPTEAGTYAAMVVAPGFTATQSAYSWQGPRFASHGFVVMTINTNSTLDQPNSRGAQILAALRYLANSSPSAVRSRVDGNRLIASGHSMGGGGTLVAADDNPALKAAIPQQPWHTQKSWPGIQVPTLIVGAQNDSVASVSSHSEPFYNSMSSASEKAYIEVAGASHFLASSADSTVVRFMLSWMKRFGDNDTRYTQFLCPGSTSGLSEYRNTCPIAGDPGGPDPTTPTTMPPDDCRWWEWWCRIGIGD
jgi:dienelactone hydrolase